MDDLCGTSKWLLMVFTVWCLIRSVLGNIKAYNLCFMSFAPFGSLCVLAYVIMQVYVGLMY